MKIVVIGLGQCGGRIADEFARLNRKARVQRGVDIITDVLAVNTDIADLSGLSYMRPDYRHRILIGGQKTSGHGVGKINELGAELAMEDGDKVIGRFTFRGTHEGPFFNLPPTGQKVTYPIIAVYRIAEGRIAEDWHIFHALGLWQSLIPEIKELIDEARG